MKTELEIKTRINSLDDEIKRAEWILRDPNYPSTVNEIDILKSKIETYGRHIDALRWVLNNNS